MLSSSINIINNSMFIHLKQMSFLNMKRLNNNYFFAFVANHLIYYPTTGSLTYACSFGFLAGMCLLTQIISGIFLAMHYTPHVYLAFSRAECIIKTKYFRVIFAEITRIFNYLLVMTKNLAFQRLPLVGAMIDSMEITKSAGSESSLVIPILIFGIALVVPFLTRLMMAGHEPTVHFHDIEALLRISKKELLGDKTVERFSELFKFINGFDEHSNDVERLAEYLFGTASENYRTACQFMNIWKEETAQEIINQIQNPALYNKVILTEFQIALCRDASGDTAVFGSVENCELIMRYCLIG